MSPRSRFVLVLIVVILGLIGFFCVSPRSKNETPVMRENPRPPASAVINPSVTVRREVGSETTRRSEAAAASLTDAPRRVRELVLPENLRRPGINTVADVLAQLDQLDESSRSEYFQSVIEFCLGQDRTGTAELLATLPDAKWREHGLSFALQHWAEADPAAALRWAADHPRDDNDHSRYHAAYEGFAGRQPMEALLALNQPDLAGDWDALSRIVIHHFSDSERLAEARDWIEQLPEGNLRELLVRQTVRVWAKEAPAEAANWLASTASEENFRAGMSELLQVLQTDDPRFAAGLTQRFADPQIREAYLADVVYSWAKRDLGGAAAWLREQPADAHLDGAIIRLVEAIAPNDPNEARQWANRISDPKKREEALRGLNSGK